MTPMRKAAAKPDTDQRLARVNEMVFTVANEYESAADSGSHSRSAPGVAENVAGAL